MTCAFVKPTSGYSTFSRFVSFTVRFSIWTSMDVSLAIFAHYLVGLLVMSESLERGRAQLAAARPLDELEVRDQLGLDEVCPARGLSDRERVLVGGERLEEAVQLLERGIREARSDLARVDELCVLVVVTGQQRSGIAAPLSL